MILLDGLDDALVGYTDEGYEDAQSVYDMEKIVEIMMESGMSHEDAIEYIDFNIVGLNAPIVYINRADRKEIDALYDH